jgi:hypothetical protein
MTMVSLELSLHEGRVGAVSPDARDRTRIVLDVDRAYRQEVLLSESFATLPGRSTSEGWPQGSPKRSRTATKVSQTIVAPH